MRSGPDKICWRHALRTLSGDPSAALQVPNTRNTSTHSNTIQHVRAETEASIPAGLKTLSGKNFSTLNKHEAVK